MTITSQLVPTSRNKHATTLISITLSATVLDHASGRTLNNSHIWGRIPVLHEVTELAKLVQSDPQCSTREFVAFPQSLMTNLRGLCKTLGCIRRTLSAGCVLTDARIVEL
jgi:hypothetical protein